MLFVMHGQAHNAQPAKFRHPRWNVVCPLDRFGYDGMGSWFLGEGGDFFWLEAIPLIISEVRARCGNGRLYFWGSSMGGYGALLHGTLNRAFAIYANLPQTVLLGSTYARNGAERYFLPLFGSTIEPRYNDLRQAITVRSRTQYYLCFNFLESGNYFGEQGLPFIEHLHALRMKTYVEVRPLAAHGLNHTIAESLELFRKYRDA